MTKIKANLKKAGAWLFGAAAALSPLSLAARERAAGQNSMPCGLQAVEKALEHSDALQDIAAGYPNSVSTIGFDALTRMQSETLPQKFDLRQVDTNGDGLTENYVSSVKSQNPWSLCWAFGSIAAVEATLAYKAGLSADIGEFDLSEKHLGFLTFTPLENDPLNDSSHDQSGEGLYFTSGAPTPLNVGGFSSYATSLFSSGIGPALEKDVPFQGKNGYVENRYGYRIREDGTVLGTDGTPVTAKDVLGKEAEDFTTPREYWFGDDWSVPEADRFQAAFELLETRILPETALPVFASADQVQTSSADFNFAGTAIDHYEFNEEAMKAIKKELVQGRAVAAVMQADTYSPAQIDVEPKFLNPRTWAHYTDGEGAGNHLICIVGYDDTYPRENFLEGHQPEKDGAWIVKNSWGAKENAFPHQNDWGLDGSGYFYISYYDHSLGKYETFDFDPENSDWHNENYICGQYDFLPSHELPNVSSPTPIYMANVFTAPDNMLIHSLSTQSATANTTTTYELYRLKAAHKNPRDGELLASVTKSYPYAGYHRIELDRGYPFKQGEELSVIITTRRADGSYEINYDQATSEIGAKLTNKMMGTDLVPIYGKGILHEGESFTGELDRNGRENWADWGEQISQKTEESQKILEEAGILEQLDSPDPLDMSKLPQGDNEAVMYVYDNFPIKYYAEYLEDELPFTDLGFEENEPMHWAAREGYIPQVFKEGLMRGKSESKFAPDDLIKRAEVAATLYRLSGESAENKSTAYADGKTGFVDVDPSAWYAPAMKWAQKNSIFTGSNAGALLYARPNDSISREELASVLYRYAIKQDGDTSNTPNKSYASAPDASEVSDWAQKGMEWAYDHGILTGHEESKALAPKEGARRGEYAKMLVTSITLLPAMDSDNNNTNTDGELI